MAKKAAEESKILHWILEHVARPQKKLDGLAICPFAKKAIVTQRYRINGCVRPLKRRLFAACESFDANNIDIHILYIDSISLPYHKKLTAEANERFPELAILYDNKENNGLIRGLQFSYQRKHLWMIQSRPQLQQYQKILRDKTNWYQLVKSDEMFV